MGRLSLVVYLRFIPTHMGNGSRLRSNPWLFSVHPHAYGERAAARRTTARPIGSSPRIWGTAWRRSLGGVKSRFIPTHMGNGWRRTPSTSTRPVHPHAYGERRDRAHHHPAMRGSSPRIWGTGSASWLAKRGTRFIPTHMGNGVHNHPSGDPTPVHPHAYGERIFVAAVQQHLDGSSPRIWGTELKSGVINQEHRFIPTHMGNGSARSPRTIPAAVHPHAYGERQVTSNTSGTVTGSSPRIWGTDPRQCGLRGVFRFIPTHMGNGAFL